VTGFFASPQAFSSLDDTWTTPPDFFAELNAEFDFGLDAAALAKSALCSNWYGPDNPDPQRRDCLTIEWDKSKAVFFNPPYGRAISKFMAKAFEQNRGGATVVCLVPARTDTAWFQDYCLPHEVRFVRGRLKFGGANPAPFPSAVVVMRGNS